MANAPFVKVKLQPTRTIAQVVALRRHQDRLLQIVNDPAIRQTARDHAAREVARIEGEIRG